MMISKKKIAEYQKSLDLVIENLVRIKMLPERYNYAHSNRIKKLLNKEDSSNIVR